MYTRTFFKDVDRNGYISTRSCHHPGWIKAISKGHFAHIRRNCDLDEDYWTQSGILLDKFLEKGYNRSELQKIRLEVSNANNNHVTNKKKKDNQFKLAFVTGYNVDYKQVEKLVIKYWPILLKDSTLNNILPRRPSFIYRKAPGLRNMIAKNVVEPPQEPQKKFLDTIGFYRCGQCKSCKVTSGKKRKTEVFVGVNGKEYKIDKFIACNSRYGGEPPGVCIKE